MRLVALLVVLACAEASAKTALVESVEWMAQDSEVVVRGVVLRVDNRSDNTSIVTFQVDESLKGGAARSLRFAMLTNEVSVVDWLRHRTEVVVFLVAPERRAKDWTFAPLALRQWHASIELDTAKVATADFLDARSREDILEATRRACSAPRVTESMIVGVPIGTAIFDENFGESGVVMSIPKEDTEVRGLRLLRSPSPAIRMAGVRSLGVTKTPSAIAVLEKLLADSTVVGDVYVLRSQAHVILTQWKVPHQEPVLRAP